MKRCKILCLEGGGIFGKIITNFLSMLPTDKQGLSNVDVLGGCSIGGILACAYAVGQPFGYIDTVFSERAKECFTKRCAAKINPFACPTYRNDTIDNVLTDMIGDYRIRDVKSVYPQLKLCVPALDITNDRYLVFTNLVHTYDDVKLKDVAGYTSAAPSYFAGRPFGDSVIIDAGLVDVSGVLTTVTAVKKYLGIPFCACDVLLIGAGDDIDEEKITLKQYNNYGLLSVATEVLVPYLTLSNKLATKDFCEGLGFHYFKYFNPVKTNGKLDDVKQVPKLAEQTQQYRDEFLQVWDEWLNN